MNERRLDEKYKCAIEAYMSCKAHRINTYFVSRILEDIDSYGKEVVDRSMEKANKAREMLGWEMTSFSLYQAVLNGEVQIELYKEGDLDAEPTD